MGRNWIFQRWPFLRVRWCVAVSGTAVLVLAAVRVAEGAEGPSIQQALAVYSQITSRTLLRQSFGSEFLALSTPLRGDTNAIANFIEKELGELGFEIIPDGKRFARVVRKGWRGSEAEKFLSRIPPPPEEDPPNAKPGEILEAGSIDYKGVDFQMVLKIYAEYRRRAVLRPTGLSTAPLWLTTQTPLSKAGI